LSDKRVHSIAFTAIFRESRNLCRLLARSSQCHGIACRSDADAAGGEAASLADDISDVLCEICVQPRFG
jgi:hypothetical protein